MEDASKNKNYTYWDLMKYRSVRIIAICTFIFSVGIHAFFYGIEISLDDVGFIF